MLEEKVKKLAALLARDLRRWCRCEVFDILVEPGPKESYCLVGQGGLAGPLYYIEANGDVFQDFGGRRAPHRKTGIDSWIQELEAGG